MFSMFEMSGYPGPLAIVPSSDTAAGLPLGAVLIDSQPAAAVTITVEGADLRVRFDGQAPSADPAGAGHILSAGQSLKLKNQLAIRGFRFISRVVGVHATLQVSPEFTSPVEV